MVLWTIQNESAYKIFKETGILRADDRFIYDDMIFHYNWMVDQMKLRIGLPIAEKISYPIWAWYWWQGIQHKKPDLRYSGHLNKGEKGVILKLKVGLKDVLLSDFNGFNNILNYGYIADNEEDYNMFYDELERYGFCYYDLQSTDKKSETLDKMKLRLYQSFEKIFDLESERDERWEGKKEEQPIQATMWEVKWEQVVSVKHFIAK